jgi:hypothetical protein
MKKGDIFYGDGFGLLHGDAAGMGEWQNRLEVIARRNSAKQ